MGKGKGRGMRRKRGRRRGRERRRERGREREGERKIAEEMSDGRRTDGHKGDFILCPMLCIALDRQ